MCRLIRRKKIWVPALVLATLGIAGWAWAARGPTYTDPDQVPYTAVVPSAASLHPGPYYGTKAWFLASAEDAFARARVEDKLVLVLHLSGRFGSSETT